MPAQIEIQHVSFSYPLEHGREQRRALQAIDLEIHEGEFVAIIGENGSGKSTLARLLTALLLPDEGQVLVDGMSTRDSVHHAQIRSRVGMIFQRPQEQVVATTLEEDVAFGPANLGLPRDEIRQRVDAALLVTGLTGMKERPSYMLSAGETQRLALAGILAMQPRCIIFDETTAMLDPSGRRMVLQQAQALNARGITIVFITHLMEEAVQAERVIALHHGRVVMDGRPSQVFASQKRVHAIGLDLPPVMQAARLLRTVFPAVRTDLLHEEALLAQMPLFKGEFGNPHKRRITTNVTQPVITIEHLAHTYMCKTPLAHQALQDANLKVMQNSRHGIVGATGCGKSTLLQHINGLIRPQSGRVVVSGRDLADDHLDVRALRQQVGLAFQLPEDQFFEQYVGDEIAFAARNFHPPHLTRELVQEAMQTVDLDFDEFKDRLLVTLSGGEKRKVALASALAARPSILLLDEPLAGLDPRSRSDIFNRLMQMHAQGTTLLISTHQFEGLVEMLDALSLMRRGRDILHGNPASVFDQADVLEESGLIAPLAVRLCWALRERGWPILKAEISIKNLLILIKKITGQGAV